MPSIRKATSLELFGFDQKEGVHGNHQQRLKPRCLFEIELRPRRGPTFVDLKTKSCVLYSPGTSPQGIGSEQAGIDLRFWVQLQHHPKQHRHASSVIGSVVIFPVIHHPLQLMLSIGDEFIGPLLHHLTGAEQRRQPTFSMLYQASIALAFNMRLRWRGTGGCGRIHS